MMLLPMLLADTLLDVETDSEAVSVSVCEFDAVSVAVTESVAEFVSVCVSVLEAVSVSVTEDVGVIEGGTQYLRTLLLFSSATSREVVTTLS